MEKVYFTFENSVDGILYDKIGFLCERRTPVMNVRLDNDMLWSCRLSRNDLIDLINNAAMFLQETKEG